MAAYLEKEYFIGDYVVQLWKEQAVEPPRPEQEPCSNFYIEYDDRAPVTLYPIIASQATLVLDVATSSALWDDMTSDVNEWWLSVLNTNGNTMVWQGKVKNQTMSRDCQTFTIMATDFGQMEGYDIWATANGDAFGLGTVADVMQTIVDLIEIPGSNTRWWSGDINYTSNIGFAGDADEGRTEGINLENNYTSTLDVLRDVAIAMRGVVFQNEGEYYWVNLEPTFLAQTSLYQYNPYTGTPVNKLKKTAPAIGDWIETFYQTNQDEDELRAGYKDSSRTQRRKFNLDPGVPVERLMPLTGNLGLAYDDDIVEIKVDGTFRAVDFIGSTYRSIDLLVRYQATPYDAGGQIYYWDGANTAWSLTPAKATAWGGMLSLGAGDEESFSMSTTVYVGNIIAADGSIYVELDVSQFNLTAHEIEITTELDPSGYKEGAMPFYDGAKSVETRIKSFTPELYKNIFPPGVGGIDVLAFRSQMPIYNTWVSGEVDGIVGIGDHLEIFDKEWVVLSSTQDFMRCVSSVSAVWNGLAASTVYIDSFQVSQFDRGATATKAAKIQVTTLQQSVFSTQTTASARRFIRTYQESLFFTETSASKRNQVAISTNQVTQFTTFGNAIRPLFISTYQESTFTTYATANVGGKILIVTQQTTTTQTGATAEKQILISTSQQSDFDSLTSWVRPAYIFDWVNGAAGLSLGKLKESATASIEVRRASDNATENIGFDVNDKIDEAALQAFCGASEGFVQVVYDQSGTGNNAAQFDQARQPKIYDGANVTRDAEGNPGMLFDGVDDYLEFGGSLATGTKWRLFYIVSSFDNCALSAGTQADGTYDLWADYQDNQRRIEQVNSDPLPISNLQYSAGAGVRMGTINWGGFGDTPAVEMIDHVAYENNIEQNWNTGTETDKAISTGVTTYETGRNRWSPAGTYSGGYLNEIVIYSE
jgi:hypothetical protein